tara:strand:- start:85 stop:549 length:465 start_codon:yes stop_codon:yes gene_type:complete
MNLLSAQDIKFSGQVFSKNNSLDDVKIEVFDNNEKVVEDVTRKNGKFKLKLAEGKIYLVKVSKDKFVSKTIIITALVGKEKAKEGFEFDIEMEKERDFRYVSKFNVDDPVAHVFYNHSKQEFDWDKELTQEKHDEIAALKELNKDKRNDKYSKF